MSEDHQNYVAIEEILQKFNNKESTKRFFASAGEIYL